VNQPTPSAILKYLVNLVVTCTLRAVHHATSEYRRVQHPHFNNHGMQGAVNSFLFALETRDYPIMVGFDRGYRDSAWNILVVTGNFYLLDHDNFTSSDSFVLKRYAILQYLG